MIDRLRTAIAAHRFSFSTEDELQRGIAEALTIAGIEFRREVVLTRQDRIDFLLPGKIGVEVKTEGSISALTRQLHRYAQLDDIAVLVVVLGRVRLMNLPAMMNEKAIHLIPVMRAF